MMATRPVRKLNITWAAAVRLAFGVAPMTANAAVEVVPTLAPITVAAPAVRGIIPLAVAVRVIAIAALDDCIRNVNRKPTPTNNNIPTPSVGRVSKVIVPAMVIKVSFRTSIPRKKRPKPAIAIPMAARLPLLTICRNMPIPIIGKASTSIFNLKPTIATSQPVIVVPILLPKIT